MNGFDLSNISGIYVGSTKYSAIYKGSTLIFRDYSAEYLTFESLEDNNVIGWKKSSSDAPTGTIQYSTDKTTWTSVTPDTTGVTLATLNTGDKLYLRGNNNFYGNRVSSTNVYNYFTSSKTFNMYGNIMSLLNSTIFSTMTTLPPYARIFFEIFSGTKVVDASNLILPATSVTSVGYYGMFEGCINLTGVPKLSATSLNSSAYNNMFYGCTSLTTPPDLPATSLSDSCYRDMFKNCTSLTNVPNLPATELKQYCYSEMFYGCTSLTTIPNNYLPVTTLVSYCYSGMFYGCTSLTSAPQLPATTLVTGCYCYMFKNCTSLTSAPQLPATTLANLCYKQMFDGCKNLNYIKMLATDISATDCISGWVNKVSASGTFVKDASMTSLPTGASGIPSGWTVQDAS